MKVHWYNDEYIKKKDAIDAITYVGTDKPTDIIPLTLSVAQKRIRDIPAADVVPKSEWISVDDRLPEKFKNVLCLYPSKNYGANIVVDYMESDRGYFAEQFRYGEPTHWMPLPLPPTEKEN